MDRQCLRLSQDTECTVLTQILFIRINEICHLQAAELKPLKAVVRWCWLVGASCHSSQCLRRNIPMLDLGWDGGLCRMGPSFSRLWLRGSCHMRLNVPD